MDVDGRGRGLERGKPVVVVLRVEGFDVADRACALAHGETVFLARDGVVIADGPAVRALDDGHAFGAQGVQFHGEAAIAHGL